MKCIKCDYELSEGADKCPRCGATQISDTKEISGVSMELPSEKIPSNTVAENPKNSTKDEVSIKPEAQKNKRDMKDTVKVAGQKAQKGIKKVADKVSEASINAVKSVSEVVDTVAEKSKKPKIIWMYVIIGLAAVAILVIIFGLLSFDGVDDEEYYNILATSDDEVFIVDGDELIPFVKDIPEDVGIRDIIVAIDGKSFYIIDNAEMDEDYNEYVGELILKKINGKEIDIDDDVVIGSLHLVEDILWYQKADKDETIICSYNGKDIIEVAQEEKFQTWFGTDKMGVAYYTVMEVKDDEYEYETFYTSKGDSDSIMKDAHIVSVSTDYKKILFISADDDKALIIYDGEDDFEVIDDVVSFAVDPDTFNMLVIEDKEDRELYYIPYSKDEIELDDEVDSILSMPYLNSPRTQEIGDMAFYTKDGHIYGADLKGEDTERIIKNAKELQILRHDNDEEELIYVDDDEIVKLNYHNLKEISISLPDAEDLRARHIKTYGKWYVYRTEENEELFAYNGKGDPIELSNDAEDISYFSIIFDGKYITWYTTDHELIISSFKENTDEEIDDDVYRFIFTDDEELYYINDYEDDEGDLYYVSKIGRDSERIEKNISSIIRIYYK